MREISLEEYHAMEPKKNWALFYKEAQGKALSLDRLLYNSWELLSTWRALPHGEHSQELWPGLEEGAPGEGKLREAFVDKSLEEQLEDLFTWHLERCPSLAKAGILDYRHCALILPPLLYLSWALAVLGRQHHGGQLPPRTPKAKKGFWKAVDGHCERHLPSHGREFKAILSWLYGSPQESLDLTSLPPVGRYLPLLRRSAPKGSQERGPLGRQRGKS